MDAKKICAKNFDAEKEIFFFNFFSQKKILMQLKFDKHFFQNFKKIFASDEEVLMNVKIQILSNQQKQQYEIYA